MHAAPKHVPAIDWFAQQATEARLPYYSPVSVLHFI